MRVCMKNLLLPVLVNIGALNFIKYFHGRRHIVLTFHKVQSLKKNSVFDSCPSVTVNNFELILTHVKNSYQLVPLNYLCDHLDSSTQLAAITFDDGWRNNYTDAYPVLKKHDIPATIFVTTGKIGSNKSFWQQRLGAIFHKAKNGDENARQVLFNLADIDQSNDLTKEFFFSNILRWKSLSVDTVEEKLSQYTSQRPTEKERVFLNEKEIQLMSNEGLVAFGSHTENHVILTNESFSKVCSELSDSRVKLEKITGNKTTMFSYPNGSVNNSVLKLAKDAGYQIGCTTQVSCIGPKVDKMLLPRIDAAWDNLIKDNDQIDKALFKWITR